MAPEGHSPRSDGTQILRVNRDGELAATADFPGNNARFLSQASRNWIGFVCGGRYLIAANGAVVEVSEARHL